MTRPAPELADATRGPAAAIRICESEVPLAPALGASAAAGADRGRVALAVIAGVEGPSYRPLGAVMAIDDQGQSWGSLSSGCIERDVIFHARQSLADGRDRHLRYGLGSPFRDLELPCGGGLDIHVIARPDLPALQQAARQLQARQPARLALGSLVLDIRPRLRFLVFGKGHEARCFSALAHAAGYPVETFAPDQETLQGLSGTTRLTGPDWPAGLQADPRTAVTLFFHDHDWEPPLLRAALETPALYIGAQGSLRAHRARCAALQMLGVAPEGIDRLASPFGLVPSARDPRTLAASVLTQVLERAQLQ